MNCFRSTLNSLRAMLWNVLSLVLLPRRQWWTRGKYELICHLFTLDLHLLRHITKLVFETSVSQGRLFLRLRVDWKVEVSLWGDDGNEKEVEALPNTPVSQFLQVALCLYQKELLVLCWRKSYWSSTWEQHIPHHSFPQPERKGSSERRVAHPCWVSLSRSREETGV